MNLNKTTSYRIIDQNGLYFITFSTVGWVDIFTRKKYKDLLIDSLIYCQDNKGLLLYEFVIMTNHIHLIAKAKDGSHLSDILRDFKRHTSKQLLKLLQSAHESRKGWLINLLKTAGSGNYKNKNFQIWKNDNHPIELYTEYVYYQKRNYIRQNPVVAGIVEVAENYIYSSAYRSINGECIIELDEI